MSPRHRSPKQPRSPDSVRAAAPEPAWWLAGAAWLGCQLAWAWTHQPVWAALAFVVIATALLTPALRERRRWAWALWCGLVALVVGATAAGVVVALMDTLAVVINALVGWLFARTLRRGRQPLLVRLVTDMEGEAYMTQTGVRSYVATLTRVWAVVMLAQAGLLLLCWLLLHAGIPAPAGSAATPWLRAYLRYGSYAVILLLFVLEYPWRKHWLPEVRQRPFPEMLQRTAASWRHVLRDGGT